MRSLLLFTRDLRVHDHPALAAASARGDVLPLYVLEPRLLRISPNRSRFLLECLLDLDRRMTPLGAPLHVRRGDAAPVAAGMARRHGCEVVFVTADASMVAGRRERRLREACASHGIEVRTVPGHAVVEPGAVTPAGRDEYRVFTPYFHAWQAEPWREPAPAPRRLRPVTDDRSTGARPDPGSIRGTAACLPPGGETAGRAAATRFLRHGLPAYGRDRDRLDLDATSHLSPYLRFGCVSAAELARRAAQQEGAEPFLRQLAWRDFFLQLLAADPRRAVTDLRSERAPVRWTGDAADLDAWRHARTGHPLVDAAMRRLVREGWIPNRARLVAASYLTRSLGIDWRRGAEHFMRHLVDGDPASNAGNWQWVAGTGANPRRGVGLDPDRQATRFDPTGAYATS